METFISRCAKVSAPRIAVLSIMAVPVAILLQLLSVSAFAGTTIQLPLPYSVGSTYFHRMAIVTGFSADGNYVIAESTGTTVTGHSGRGSTIRRTYECVRWTWDLAGNVVNEAVLDSLHACPAPRRLQTQCSLPAGSTSACRETRQHEAAEIAASLSPANQASGARALSQFSASLTHIEPPSGISASLKS